MLAHINLLFCPYPTKVVETCIRPLKSLRYIVITQTTPETAITPTNGSRTKHYEIGVVSIMVILIREPSIAVSLIIMALTICQAKPVKVCRVGRLILIPTACRYRRMKGITFTLRVNLSIEKHRRIGLVQVDTQYICLFPILFHYTPAQFHLRS